MTSKQLTLTTLIAVLALTLGGVATAASVEPVLFETWQSGDAAFECNQAGDCGAYAYKVDGWGGAGMDGDYEHAGNVITVYGSDGGTFSWSSVYPVCTVIVKGGPVAFVYYYPGGAYGDTGLVAPVNPNNGQNYGISHVSFCFNDPDMCYQEETAWAAGTRYNRRGNWATYVTYAAGATVDIYAGQTMLAGTATFSAPVDGSVEITINLTGGFVFYYDVTDLVEDDNVKVQDYANAPMGNPAPGLFAWKESATVGSTSYTVTVPANNFYGVHLDVAYQVPCE